MNRLKSLFVKDLKIKIIALLITLHIVFVKKAADQKESEEVTVEKGVEK